MKIIEHNPEGLTVHLTGKEIVHLLFMVQEGRMALLCENPTGQALDEGLREAAATLYAAS